MNPQKDVYIFHDEREVNKGFLYHGFLILPYEYINKWNDMIESVRGKHGYHKEIHFTELKNDKFKGGLAKELLHKSLNRIRSECGYFYSIGINLKNIDKSIWKREGRSHKIYNRFFEIGLRGGLKWFFLNDTAGFDRVTVKEVVSDDKDRSDDDFFTSKPIFEAFSKTVNNPDGRVILFDKSSITTLDSDKNKSGDDRSNFLQVVDLILGSCSQLWDATSSHSSKNELALTVSPILDDLHDTQNDKPNFSSDFYKKFAVSFFPKDPINNYQEIADETGFSVNQFYHFRPLYRPGQVGLGLFD